MKISIIIPTCNEEKEVGRLLDCLLNLSLDKEIIVTDDASTDKTVQVLEKYGGKIKIIAHRQRNKSIAANRNAGAKYASGDFFVFMDGTTYLQNPDEFFRRALSIFEKNKDLIAVTGKLKVLPEFETFTDKIMHYIFNFTVMVKDNYLGMTEASGKFEMIRREAFQKVGGFNGDLITREDADMFGRLSKIGRTRYVSSLAVLYTGRRAHILGWPKLLFIWMTETLWVWIFGKARTKEWKVIR